MVTASDNVASGVGKRILENKKVLAQCQRRSPAMMGSPIFTVTAIHL
jgi:hypothetical protein